MILYSYVVARDYGFAPNPFFGVCTLATCKPDIRGHASIGDWVVGTGGAAYGLTGRLVFAMEVSEILTFDEYWSDPRFDRKQPSMNSGLRNAFGDNIYRQVRDDWVQANSHHSLPNGQPNPANIQNDTRFARVLIGKWFVYWGREGPHIPARFRGKGLKDLCAIRGYKCKFSAEFINDLTTWIFSLGQTGYVGRPAEYP
jgi:hypothetical protein